MTSNHGKLTMVSTGQLPYCWLGKCRPVSEALLLLLFCPGHSEFVCFREWLGVSLISVQGSLLEDICMRIGKRYASVFNIWLSKYTVLLMHGLYEAFISSLPPLSLPPKGETASPSLP